MAAKREEMGRNGRAGLTPRQEAAALALASGATIPEAARKANCGATTVSTWLHDLPAFRRRIAELREQLTERALGKLADAMTAAVDTLRELCSRGKTETTRLKASDALLTHGVKVPESAELRRQLAAMQEQLSALEAGRGRMR
jgi:transposase-like protein